MYETGLPYSLDPHTLETLGMETFNGDLMLKAFAAHFRLDMKQEVSHSLATESREVVITKVQDEIFHNLP